MEMMHKNKKVFVVVYAKKNVGDDLFLHILFSRYPDVQFGLMAPESYQDFVASYGNVSLVPAPKMNLWEGVVCRLESLLNISIFSRKAFLHNRRAYMSRRLAEGYNGFLHIGGSLFIQQAPGIGTYELTNTIVPQYFPDSFIIGCNWGPCFEDAYRDYYTSKVFPFYKEICFRDRTSYNLFRELKNVRYAPDIVFQYTPQATNLTPKHIGISVINFSKRENLMQAWPSYVSKMSKTITDLHKEGYQITLFSFCKFEGDERAIENITKRLPQGVNVKCVYYDGNLNAFLQEYGKMDTMVTLRFHSLVLSLIMGQKICPLIYSNKVTNLLSDIRYEGFSARLSELDRVDLVKEIKEAKKTDIPLEEYAVKARDQFAGFERLYLNV